MLIFLLYWLAATQNQRKIKIKQDQFIEVLGVEAFNLKNKIIKEIGTFDH